MIRPAIFVLPFLLCLSGCDQPASNSTSREQPADSSSAPSSNPLDAGPSWEYSETVDQMRGTKTRFASIDSTNELSFGFPYSGGKATLTLRQRPTDGLNVMLRISGQFICNSFSGDTVAAKFDDGRIQTYPCGDPADGSSGVIFIGSEKRFVARLKKAKTLTIEATFYQQGRQQMQFDIAGLNWK